MSRLHSVLLLSILAGSTAYAAVPDVVLHPIYHAEADQKALDGLLTSLFHDGDTVQVERSPWRVHDIGAFAPLHGTPGADLLLSLWRAEASPPAAAVRALVRNLDAPPAGVSARSAFRSVLVGPVGAKQRAELTSLLDRSFDRPDFKMRLSARSASRQDVFLEVPLGKTFFQKCPT